MQVLIAPSSSCQQVADRLLQRVLAAGTLELGWDWGAGLLCDAIGEWTDRRAELKTFLRAWATRHAKAGSSFDDAGGWLWKAGSGTTLLRLEAWSPSARRRKAIAQLAQRVVDCPRGTKGIWLTKPDRQEVWVDTLATACPFLVRAGLAAGEPCWSAEAAEQIIRHAEVLQCQASGLWGHAWDDRHHCPMGLFWARGNGWALHALAETLVASDAQPEAASLTRLLAQTCEGLLNVQSPCGAWHTVLDDFSTYVETSGQAMIVRGLARASPLLGGSLRERTRSAALRGWIVLRGHITDSGEVAGTSLGTPAGSWRDYAERPTASWPVWGAASALYAARSVGDLIAQEN